MPDEVEFRIVRRDKKATCACGVVIPALPDGSYRVSPHLKDVHGFTDDITFEQTYEVICPPMLGMKATCRDAPRKEQ